MTAVAAGGRPLLAILALALVLRIAVACWPAFAHADEIWQYLEPARHVAGRPWAVTWESRAGARGWLLPVLVAGPSTLGQWLAPGTFLSILLPRLVCALGSLAAVIAAWGLGSRLSRRHGLVAAIVAATWFEIVYFAPRTLTEPVATALILVAACLLADRRRLPLAGLLLGLACAIRFQYAPAAFVLVAWSLRGDWRGWVRLTLGGVAGLCASGLADAAMGAVPFGWVARNVSANLIQNRSADYGTSPWWGYLPLVARTWGAATPVVLVLAAIGARRYPALAAVALVNLAVHALIPHKEARFVLLSTAIAVVLAAIGSVDLWQRRWPALRFRTVAALWCLLSLAGAVTMPGWRRLVRLDAAWRSAAQVPGVCGIGIARAEPLVAAYALLGRDVPIYHFGADDAAARRSRAYDVLLLPRADRGALPGFADRGCGGDRPDDLCVASRPGGCTVTPADAPFAIDAALARANM